MQVIREIQSVLEHQVVINLPDTFDAKRVEVIVIPYNKSTEDDELVLEQQSDIQERDSEEEVAASRFNPKEYFGVSCVPKEKIDQYLTESREGW